VTEVLADAGRAVAAGSTAGDGAVADSDAIVVRLGAGRFAVALSSVAEVGNVPAVTRVPGVPHWLAGVANWRGRILPALDLRSILGAEGGPFGPRARLVVLVTESATVGLLVDGVDGTTAIAGEMAAFPSDVTGAATELVAGQLPREDGPVAVLDVAAVVRLRDALPQGRRSA
jgi:chemotaxis signal transduction protein